MPRGVPIKPEKEARIVARLQVEQHASLVAREERMCFSTVWRLAERGCIERLPRWERRPPRSLQPRGREQPLFQR